MTNKGEYTYDEISKTYKAALITIDMYGDEIEVTDVEMSFRDGKPVKVRQERTESVRSLSFLFFPMADSLTVRR